jgi:hypothetical protein
MAEVVVNDNQEYYLFLNQLRRSGQINMFGASPVLQEMFELNRHEAKKVLLEWMQQYKGE